MTGGFVIRSFSERLTCDDADAIVAIDVIRATTTAITAAANGQRCFIAPSIDAARGLSESLGGAWIAGELHGACPPGFDFDNSPAAIAALQDRTRPIVLLSTSGTRLMSQAGKQDEAFAACFRNARATAQALIAEGYERVALIGAESRGEFREEDQICCAWIGARLRKAGYSPADEYTSTLTLRWGSAVPHACLGSKSVDFLRRSGQTADLNFVLEHIDDLDFAARIQGNEVVVLRESPEGFNSRNKVELQCR
jgi:2-phosphosulfolactate phosphatase